jgi:hypothetical protein
VQLQGAALCCGAFPGLGGSDRLELPPLNAVVLDFPQSHLDPAHDVAGMLGQEGACHTHTHTHMAALHMQYMQYEQYSVSVTSAGLLPDTCSM